MGFLIRRAAIRLAFGGAGAFGARLRGWRRALAPQPVKVRIPVRPRPH